ncbi:hypothetical protein SISNIDRAFT_471084 [Sistotremastrum niveocremeum HHB9708]|uniref:Uncharacterized protein n=1 Tax=Sistotremastrum niveocremeum HHB9708 TaxID=1314777 RepID=A0A164N405_9AGAM|nr:hypothetical protein SISNIDRAFT_471084 [Sistotremastrum niveocremeum HHB9708]
MSRSQSPLFSPSPMDRDSSPPYGPPHMDRDSSPPYGYSPVYGKFKPGERLGNPGLQPHHEIPHLEAGPSAALPVNLTHVPSSKPNFPGGYWTREDNGGYAESQLIPNQSVTLEITISSKLAWITLGLGLLIALMVSITLHSNTTSLGRSSRLDLPHANNGRLECPYGFSAMRSRKDEM